MKNWFIAAILSTGIMFSSCQDSKKETETRADEKNMISETDVPGNVKTAFTTKYPGASEVIWEDAHEGDAPTFKVKFKKDDKFWKAEFKNDGSLVKEKED